MSEHKGQYFNTIVASAQAPFALMNASDGYNASTSGVANIEFVIPDHQLTANSPKSYLDIGIVATEDISAGEELLVEYKWDDATWAEVRRRNLWFSFTPFTVDLIQRAQAAGDNGSTNDTKDNNLLFNIALTRYPLWSSIREALTPLHTPCPPLQQKPTADITTLDTTPLTELIRLVSNSVDIVKDAKKLTSAFKKATIVLCELSLDYTEGHLSAPVRKHCEALFHGSNCLLVHIGRHLRAHNTSEDPFDGRDFEVRFLFFESAMYHLTHSIMAQTVYGTEDCTIIGLHELADFLYSWWPRMRHWAHIELVLETITVMRIADRQKDMVELFKWTREQLSKPPPWSNLNGSISTYHVVAVTIMAFHSRREKKEQEDADHEMGDNDSDGDDDDDDDDEYEARPRKKLRRDSPTDRKTDAIATPRPSTRQSLNSGDQDHDMGDGDNGDEEKNNAAAAAPSSPPPSSQRSSPDREGEYSPRTQAIIDHETADIIHFNKHKHDDPFVDSQGKPLLPPTTTAVTARDVVDFAGAPQSLYPHFRAAVPWDLWDGLQVVQLLNTARVSHPSNKHCMRYLHVAFMMKGSKWFHRFRDDKELTFAHYVAMLGLHNQSYAIHAIVLLIQGRKHSFWGATCSPHDVLRNDTQQTTLAAGSTALHFACGTGDLSWRVVVLLLTRGLSPVSVQPFKCHTQRSRGEVKS